MATEVKNYSSGSLTMNVFDGASTVSYHVGVGQTVMVKHKPAVVVVDRGGSLAVVGVQQPSWLYSTVWQVGQDAATVQVFPAPLAYPVIGLKSPLLVTSLLVVSALLLWRVFRKRWWR